MKFPQPQLKPLYIGQTYYCVKLLTVYSHTWECDSIDMRSLESKNIYLTKEDAEKRVEWEKEQLDKVTIPQWYIDLGPDVEFNIGGIWHESAGRGDWTNANPKDYRAKPKDVVCVVNGKEFRWPVTVNSISETDDKYAVTQDGVIRTSAYSGFRKCVHYTKAGAQAQYDAIQSVINSAN